MTAPILPAGFNPVPTGEFAAGEHTGQKVEVFGMKATPVTNAEYRALVRSLGEDRFVRLHHDWQTGETTLEKTGATLEEIVAGPVTLDPGGLDHGRVIMLGATILLEMTENPSAHYDSEDVDGMPVSFSGADQPVVGITYFHAQAWCLLKSLAEGGRYQYDLPTDLEYEYVASDRGTKEYGTATGRLMNENGEMLVCLRQSPDALETTVAVNDPSYAQNWPLGIQTTGNVWRFTKFDPKYRSADPQHSETAFNQCFGLRGGAFSSNWAEAKASFRHHIPTYHHMADHFSAVGFSPVVRRSK